ncbi:hypothetical protein OG365_04695 [Streptomyces sp. NBC_00853]|uniref:hypothetical protein n=1 Tax=Streptomyces sp. NBC_00853 TaxID=2903681 RepID=UPI0038730B4C|nr:hypothetical protein OG365_04695 [Streptomyces sp. NBC_00853]
MLETGVRHVRVAMAMVFGRRLNVRAVERLVADALLTLEEFGSLGDDVDELADGPFADPDEHRDLQDRALRRTVRRLAERSPFYRERLAGIDLDDTTAATLTYQPLIGNGRLRWALIAVLVASVLVAHLAFGETAPPYWVANSTVVALIVVSATNLNVQGGMRLKNVAWFLLALTVYDAFFAWVVPLTQQLSDAVQGYPYAPAAGLRIGEELGAVVGMGDLLAYALFTTTAYKAYAKRGLRTGIALVTLFGAVAPVATLHVLAAVTDHAPTLIPAQVFFGPAAFLGYRYLRRSGPERRMADVVFRGTRGVRRGAVPQPPAGRGASVEPVG